MRSKPPVIEEHEDEDYYECRVTERCHEEHNCDRFIDVHGHISDGSDKGNDDARIYVLMYEQLYMCSTCLQMYIHVYTNSYMYIYIHTQTYTRICIQHSRYHHHLVKVA